MNKTSTSIAATVDPVSQGYPPALGWNDHAVPAADRTLAAQLAAELAEAKRHVARLEAQLDEARTASERKTSFVAMMSHELRTPLNAIIGFSDAALREIRGPLPPAYRDYVQDIRNAGQYLAELIDSALDAARLEGGHVPLATRPVSARLLIAEARSIIAMRAEQEGIDIGPVQITGDWLLKADPVRARQIFVNLLTNAIKFTPSGGRIGVDVSRVVGETIDIAVWDTGIGIDTDHQPRIFDAFYQVPGSEIRAGSKGAGLGLAISRQLAHAMGGDILLQSEPSQGSRFIVRLPLFRETDAAAALGR
ncbi:MAG TPA: HAMP domain-containing sensor histidine kinase [Stellaceae bacterium]|jgi:signal transduction histidine kinase